MNDEPETMNDASRVQRQHSSFILAFQRRPVNSDVGLGPRV